MHVFSFRPGVSYTIRHIYNGPGRPTTRSFRNHKEAAAHLRRLLAMHRGNPLRTDWVEIEGSDGTARTYFP